MAETLDYSAVQVAKDRDYAAAYEKWTTSLSEDEKARLADLDIAEPKIDRKSSGPTLATDDFRNSTSTAGTWLTNHADDGWHPGLPVPEDADEIDDDELVNLSRQNAEIIGSIFRVILTPDLGRGVNAKATLTKVIAMAHALGIEGVRSRSLESLSQQIGCSRALLSYYIVRIRDRVGLDCRAGKSTLARDRLSASRLWNTCRRDGTKKRREAKAGGTM